MMMRVGLDDIAARFVYVTPEARPEDGLDELLTEQRYDLAVVDGVTEALAISGLKTNDNDDVTGWMRRVPRRIADQTGAAVVTVDHVTKSTDRSRYAIGAQAKLAALSGPAYIFEVAEPMGRGMRGVVQVRIAKDRPGGVRPHASQDWRASDRTQHIATVVVDSTGSGTVFTIEPPEVVRAKYDNDLQAQQTALRVAELVQEEPGVNASALKQRIKEATGIGNSRELVNIIADAVLRGLIREQAGRRNSKEYYPGNGADMVGWVEANG